MTSCHSVYALYVEFTARCDYLSFRGDDIDTSQLRTGTSDSGSDRASTMRIAGNDEELG